MRDSWNSENFLIYSYVSLNNDILVQDFKRRVHVNKKTIVSLIHYEIKLKWIKVWLQCMVHT